jgi:hypothetical protein
VKEMVISSGTIVGENQQVECKVRATKTTLGGDPSIPPEFSDYRIMDSDVTDRLPDGDYELLVNGQRIRLRRNGGRFLGRL